ANLAGPDKASGSACAKQPRTRRVEGEHTRDSIGELNRFDKVSGVQVPETELLFARGIIAGQLAPVPGGRSEPFRIPRNRQRVGWRDVFTQTVANLAGGRVDEQQLAVVCSANQVFVVWR